MKNSEKFQTAEERVKAFNGYCEAMCKRDREGCDPAACVLEWLEFDVEEEKPLPCPFCWMECIVNRERKVVRCSNCSYTSITGWTMEDAITAHNRVARAVMEAGKCTS